jgi:hypothetical protein
MSEWRREMERERDKDGNNMYHVSWSRPDELQVTKAFTSVSNQRSTDT